MTTNPVEPAFALLTADRTRIHDLIQKGHGAEDMWQDLQTVDHALNRAIFAAKVIEIMQGFFQALVESNPKLVTEEPLDVYDQSIISRHVRALLILLKQKHPEVYSGIIRTGAEVNPSPNGSAGEPTEPVSDQGVEGR